MQLVRGSVASSTHVTFPAGEVTGRSPVLDVVTGLAQNRIALLLEKTPFHPVDLSWPDQPADRGVLSCNGRMFKVEECKIFAVHKENKNVVESQEVPRGDKANWSLTVAHIIDPEEADPQFFLGVDADCSVDEGFRSALNLQHSASHLSALALNMATKDFWSKPAKERDSLGNPNIDSIAMDKSFIHEEYCEDTYRFGKSIKKDGLKVEDLFAGIKEVEAKVNELLASWIKTGADVQLTTAGPALDDTRKWRCEIPGVGVAELPCGGTHVKSLSVFEKIVYEINAEESQKAGEKRLHAVARATPKAA